MTSELLSEHEFRRRVAFWLLDNDRGACLPYGVDREEYAEPVLVFVDPEEPDKEVNLVTNDGVAAIWYPQEDGYGNLFLPTDEDGAPLLYDFAIYGYTTGLDYPEGWEPSGDDW